MCTWGGGHGIGGPVRWERTLVASLQDAAGFRRCFSEDTRATGVANSAPIGKGTLHCHRRRAQDAGAPRPLWLGLPTVTSLRNRTTDDSRLQTARELAHKSQRRGNPGPSSRARATSVLVKPVGSALGSTDETLSLSPGESHGLWLSPSRGHLLEAGDEPSPSSAGGRRGLCCRRRLCGRMAALSQRSGRTSQSDNGTLFTRGKLASTSPLNIEGGLFNVGRASSYSCRARAE